MNTQLDPITVFPSEVDHQALNVSRDWNPDFMEACRFRFVCMLSQN